MPFILSSKNIFEYLLQLGLCNEDTSNSAEIEVKPAKNFNLLVKCGSDRSLLVKQERLGAGGKTANEFLNEWQFHQLLRHFQKLNSMTSFVSEVVNFDQENSIIIYNYLLDYTDLDTFYRQEQSFPIEIARTLGTTLATLHRHTFNIQEYHDFISHTAEDISRPQFSHAVSAELLNRIEPEIFGLVPTNCLKFFVLYQRYDSLSIAVQELVSHAQLCCLTHNDLKLNNILLHHEWERSQTAVSQLATGDLRLIDWERSAWGDPAFDLGTLIASYLQIWLNSLVVDPSISLEASLRIAGTPLDKLQPSLIAMIRAYLNHFPITLEHYPDFLTRTIQYAGLALIQQIVGTIQHQKYFGNSSICLLQVAKSLLCRPETSFSSIFGITEAELKNSAYAIV
uniref:Aminoglycoside phosphotranslferase n=1 Tax=Nostoc sp. PCC 9205 TaxID=2099383 RepID=A0A2P0ZGM8_9NOSO|nr:aminoglycoside phosphotranslferase [Nostoc sp. PCC 9205]